MQKLYLVKERFPALLAGEKTDTIRWNEGEIKPGLLLYESYPDKSQHAIVWVTQVTTLKLKNVPDKVGKDKEPDAKDLERRIKKHYPNITLETRVLLVEHLTPDETKERYLE